MNKLTEIEALAFDLDGTLVDSLPGLTVAIDQLMQEAGLAAPGIERVRGWVGNGADTLIERAIAWGSPAGQTWDFRMLRLVFDQHYSKSVLTGSLLYPGAALTLQRLANWPLAIVTNKPTKFIVPLLQSLGIDHYFSHIIGGDDVSVKKPHPAALYLLLGKFGLLPNQLLMVGDSRNDILAAKAAGCYSAGMTYGYNHGEPIADYRPDWVLDRFDQLLALLPAEKLNK